MDAGRVADLRAVVGRNSRRLSAKTSLVVGRQLNPQVSHNSCFAASPNLHFHPIGMDVPAYLARISYRGPMDPSAETLRGLHRAHLYAVPFENLDICLGRTITTKSDSFTRLSNCGGADFVTNSTGRLRLCFVNWDFA